MRNFEKIIIKNLKVLILIAIGAALTSVAMDYCMVIRGGMKIGGEVLILPILIAAYRFLVSVAREVIEVLRMEGR